MANDVGGEILTPSQPKKNTLNRRQFLRGSAGVVGGLVAAAVLPPFIAHGHGSSPDQTGIPAAQASSETQEFAPVTDMPGDIIFSSKNSGIPNDLIRFPGEAQTAGAEHTLGEPVSELVDTSTGTDEEGDSYREYKIRYKGEEFTARAKIIPSTRYAQLQEQFNIWDDPNPVEKPITMITFSAGNPTAKGLSEITMYCLQSLVDDPNNPDKTFALLPDFYDVVADEENPQLVKKTLKESWTALQFAQAFNPKTIKCISDNTSVQTYNSIRDADSTHTIHNASVIFAHLDERHGAISISDPELPSDSGGLWNAHGRTPAEVHMHRLAETLAHELRHGTDFIIAPDGSEHGGFAERYSPDLISESFAEMSAAGFLFDYGGYTDIAESYFTTQYPFQLREGSFDFRPYSANLPPIVIQPYFADMVKALGDNGNYYDETSAITVEGLVKMNKFYMALRDEFQRVVGLDWFGKWRYDKAVSVEYDKKLSVLNHIDLYAPLVLAKRWNERETIAQNKDLFLHDVEQFAKEHALPSRVKALQQAFIGDQKELKPYFQDVLEKVIPQFVNDSGFPQVTLPTEIGQNSTFTRPRDKKYTGHENEEDFYGKDYREFHPMYHFASVEKAPENMQYSITQTSPTESYTVAIKYVDEEGRIETHVLQSNESFILDKTRRAVICFLDKRTNQVVDDVQGNTPEIFTISAEKFIPPPPPPPEKQEIYLPKVEA